MKKLSILFVILLANTGWAFELKELGNVELSSNQAWFTHAGVARANFASPSNNVYTLDLKGINTIKYTLHSVNDGPVILERDFEDLVISDSQYIQGLDLLMIVGLDRSSWGNSTSVIQLMHVSDNNVLKRVSVREMKSYLLSEKLNSLFIDKGLGKIDVYSLDDFSKTEISYDNNLRPVFSESGVFYIEEGSGQRGYKLLDSNFDKVFEFESRNLQFLNPDQKVAINVVNDGQFLVYETKTYNVFTFYDTEKAGFILPDSEMYNVSHNTVGGHLIFIKGREVRYWDSSTMTNGSVSEDFIFNLVHGTEEKTLVYWSFPERGLVQLDLESGAKKVADWYCSTQNYYSKSENMVLCTDDDTVRWVKMEGN